MTQTISRDEAKRVVGMMLLEFGRQGISDLVDEVMTETAARLDTMQAIEESGGAFVRIETDSSMFFWLAYNATTQTLRVMFKPSRKVWEYLNFSVTDWNDFARAGSHGEHYNDYIKGQYHGTQVYEGFGF